MVNVDLLIGGERRKASSGATFERRNPISSAVVTVAAAATLQDADDAVAAAHRAQSGWAASPPAERRARLLSAATLLEQKMEGLIALGVAEIGGAPGWYGFNVSLAANMLREAASMTTQITGEVIPSNLPGNLALAVRQPAGVVLGIAPWNAPVILAVRAIAMPLACGNAVVLKSSELCPATHQLIGLVLQEAGLDGGVVNVLSHAPSDAPQLVERLIANPMVRRVNFTGSTAVGRIVGELSGKHLKPALLELGGKAPFLVLDDADLAAATEAAAFGAFFNQGQICMSTERLIVHQAVADDFVESLSRKAASLHAGNPEHGSSVLASMVSAQAAGRMKSLIEDAVRKGASITAGGGIEGSIAQPTILDHVTPAMLIYGEESFGPVVCVMRVKDDDDAVRVANDTEYGLAAAIFSRDVSRALGLAARLQSGICHINGATVHDEAQMPFGGVGASGYGRFGGKAAIDEFTELRWITIQNVPRHYPI